MLAHSSTAIYRVGKGVLATVLSAKLTACCAYEAAGRGRARPPRPGVAGAALTMRASCAHGADVASPLTKDF